MYLGGGLLLVLFPPIGCANNALSPRTTRLARTRPGLANLHDSHPEMYGELKKNEKEGKTASNIDDLILRAKVGRVGGVCWSLWWV